MTIIAIDSSGAASAAAVRDGAVADQRSAFRARAHAEFIGTALNELHAAHPTTDLVVVGVGPGPFTGLRAGIAAGIGYGIGAHAPVVGLPSHTALALRVYREFPELTRLVVATDARRREVYATEFAGCDEQGIPLVATPPQVIAPADLAAQLTPEHARAGLGFLLNAEVLGAPLSDRADLLEPTAGDLGLVAELMRQAEREFLPVTPLYLREPDAQPLATA